MIYSSFISIISSIIAKTYESDEEEQKRYQKFSKNLAHIIDHNSEQALGMHSYTLGLNEYADMVRLIIPYSILHGIQIFNSATPKW